MTAGRHVKPVAALQGMLAAYGSLTGGLALAGDVSGHTAGILAILGATVQSYWTVYTLTTIREQAPPPIV